jgi:hypothetical protein
MDSQRHPPLLCAVAGLLDNFDPNAAAALANALNQVALALAAA